METTTTKVSQDTTDKNTETEQLKVKPMRSLRPMKSMVKISSLKPKRIKVTAKLRKKAIRV